jgi:LacI family kdg operon repressor
MIDTVSSNSRKARHRRPTIRDVARDAGVSKTSVSRYFGPERKRLSSGMLQRIEASIERLGFRPDRIAASLRGRRTRLIGVLVADMRNPYSVALIHGAEVAARSAGYSLVVCNTDGDDTLERRHLDVLDGYSVEGLIVNTPGQNADLLAERQAAGLPMVLVDRKLTGMNCDLVGLDNEQALAIAVDHLSKQGYRDLLLVSPPSTLVSSRAARVTAFRDECARHQLTGQVHEQPFDPADTQSLDSRLTTHIDSTQETAVICTNGVVTLAVCRALHRLQQLRFDAIGVLGIDELDWCALVGPGITTIAQPVTDIASAAVERLLARIDHDGDALSEHSFAPVLIVRGSTRGPARKQPNGLDFTLAPRNLTRR